MKQRVLSLWVVTTAATLMLVACGGKAHTGDADGGVVVDAAGSDAGSVDGSFCDVALIAQ